MQQDLPASSLLLFVRFKPGGLKLGGFQLWQVP